MKNGNIVQSVDRALQIVQLVSRSQEGCRVTQLAQQLGVNKSTVFRLLATLAKHDFIEQDPESERYKLGYKYLELSSRLLDSIDLRHEAKPYLKQLEKETNEVVHLVVYNQGEVVYIEKLEGNETLRMHSQVGKRAPMHCTGVGKVILAHLKEQEMLRIIEQKGLPKHTEYTITDKTVFLQQLDTIRKQGYALDLEENELGIICVAAPIFNHLGQVVAAVSISGPTVRMKEARLDELKGKVMRVCQSISARLGYSRKTK